MTDSPSPSFAMSWIGLGVVALVALLDLAQIARGRPSPWYHWSLLVGIACILVTPMIRARNARAASVVTALALALTMAGAIGIVRVMSAH